MTVDAAKLPDLGGSGWVRDLREAATEAPVLAGLVQKVKDAGTQAQYKAVVGELLRAWGNSSPYESASEKALTVSRGGINGFGLILSEPENAEERGWMDMAIKASDSVRMAFRDTLSVDAAGRFDAMRERMVGGLEKLGAYEAFTGHTFLTWEKLEHDAFHWSPNNQSDTTGRPVEVWVPLSIIIAEQRMAMPSEIEGYVHVTVPQPTNGLPHVEFLWDRLVMNASENLRPLRLEKLINLVSLDITVVGVAMNFSSLNGMLANGLGADAYEGALTMLDVWQLYGDTLSTAGWNGPDQVSALGRDSVNSDGIKRAFAERGIHVFGATATSGTSSEDIFNGDERQNAFSGNAGNDMLSGGGGNDTLNGEDGADRLLGDEGNDQLNGGNGNDTLDGGAGNDRMDGGDGSDVYLWGRDSGQDTIFNYDDEPQRQDTVRIKAGTVPQDVTLQRSGNDIYLGIAGTQDTLRLYNVLQNDGDTPWHIDKVEFADGTVWNKTVLQNKLLQGGNGNGTLLGYASDDVLTGGSGNETLTGGGGSDTLDGGAGNDRMDGGDGSDVYLWGRDSGQDTIFNYDDEPQRQDTVRIKAGTVPQDVTLQRSGNDIYLGIAGTQDTLRLYNVLQNDGDTPWHIDKVEFANGTVWNIVDLVGLTK